MKKYNTPIPTIEGVEVVHVPVFKTEDYSPEVMAGYATSSTLSFLISTNGNSYP